MNKKDALIFCNPFGIVIFLLYIVIYAIVMIGKFIYDSFKTNEY